METTIIDAETVEENTQNIERILAAANGLEENEAIEDIMLQQFSFKGQLYTVESFRAKFAPTENLIDVCASIDLLISQGKIVVKEYKLDKGEKALAKAAKEQSLKAQAELYDQYEEEKKNHSLLSKREDLEVYDSVELEFAHLGQTQEFQAWVVENLRLETIVTIQQDLSCVLTVFNVTDYDIKQIETKYKIERNVSKSVDMIARGFNKATGGVGYTANNELQHVE